MTDRPSPLVALLTALATGILLAGCADGAGEPTSDVSPTPGGSPTAVAGATEACGPTVEPPLQDGSHLIGDSEPPVPYSSTPATSGWHASGNPRTGVIPADDPLTDPELVLTIEVGHVVAAYDPDRLAEDAVGELERLATGTYPDRLTVTPYEGADAPLTLVAWGVLRPCDELDPAAVDAFVTAHADPDADPH